MTNGSAVTTFSYDAAGQRTRTQQPNGVKTYYPFPGYEEEVNGATTTRRTTYSLAGQAIAVRVQVVGGSNTVYYLHSDHLGSTTALSSSAVGGGLVSGSTARYYPFGAWRTTPTQTLTDRGYTGHLENMEIGLVYMRARFYVPSIGRFASADTIVPEPADPQSVNRYSYVRNQPLNLIDPSGHRECGRDCDEVLPHEPPPTLREQVQQGSNVYGVEFQGDWTEDQQVTVLSAAATIDRRLRSYAGVYTPGYAFRQTFGTVTMRRSTATTFINEEGEEQDIWYGGMHMQNGLIEFYNPAFGSALVPDLRNLVAHELGHAFNASINNATNAKVDPYKDLSVALGENGSLHEYGFRSGMESYPWQMSTRGTAGEIFADYFLNWTFQSFNDEGVAQFAWMSGQMSRWLRR